MRKHSTTSKAVKILVYIAVASLLCIIFVVHYMVFVKFSTLDLFRQTGLILSLIFADSALAAVAIEYFKFLKEEKKDE